MGRLRDMTSVGLGRMQPKRFVGDEGVHPRTSERWLKKQSIIRELRKLRQFQPEGYVGGPFMRAFHMVEHEGLTCWEAMEKSNMFPQPIVMLLRLNDEFPEHLEGSD